MPQIYSLYYISISRGYSYLLEGSSQVSIQFYSLVSPTASRVSLAYQRYKESLFIQRLLSIIIKVLLLSFPRGLFYLTQLLRVFLSSFYQLVGGPQYFLFLLRTIVNPSLFQVGTIQVYLLLKKSKNTYTLAIAIYLYLQSLNYTRQSSLQFLYFLAQVIQSFILQVPKQALYLFCSFLQYIVI